MDQPSGFFLIDKPAGISSAAAIAQLRRRLNIEKIGHAGTLDPAATGLLVVLVNRATRLADLATGGGKEYRGTIVFGRQTSTDDLEGETVREGPLPGDPGIVERSLAVFRGVIQQVPPQISALKVDGVPAYRRARRGEDVVLAARTVTIDLFTVERRSDAEYEFTVRCSKGTYIRSLARDLGTACGTVACLGSLRRTESAPFSVAEAKQVDQLGWEDLVPWHILFPRERRITVADGRIDRLIAGDERMLFELRADLDRNRDRDLPYVVYGREESEPVGLLRWESDRWSFAGVFGGTRSARLSSPKSAGPQ